MRMLSNKNISLKPIVFLFGPTASGKTDLAINLAKKFPVEIISVDSVMVYKNCDIGSAKPNKNVLEKYPHHLVDIIYPDEVFSVADFYKRSLEIIEISHNKNKLPIFVGGSMMYFRSLYSGIDDLPERDQKFRDDLKRLKSNSEDTFLHKKLSQIDPDYGKKMSEVFSDNLKQSLSNKFNVAQFCISVDRDILHKRIKNRLKKIIELGLINEVKNILKKYDIDCDHPLRKSINYRQAFDFIEKKCDYETFFNNAFFATRQLAKRQSTWIRSWDKFKGIDPNKTEMLENDIKKLITAL